MDLFVMGLSASGGVSRTFFADFFLAGGPIVWFVLLPMSVITLYMAMELMFLIRRKRQLPAASKSQEILTMAGRYGLGGLPSRLGGAKDLVSRALVSALSRAGRTHPSAGLLRQMAEESVQEQCFALMRKADWCGLIGSVAPMVGLFGTVYGMIRAFNILGISGGQPPPGQLAESISVALVTTFWGLLVAIPALFLAGFFRTRIEGFACEAAVEAEALLERITEAAALGTKVSQAGSVHSADGRGSEKLVAVREVVLDKRAAAAERQAEIKR